MEDFKIASALINFFHSRFISDKLNSEKIASSMKNKLLVKKLECLIKKPRKNIKNKMTSLDAFEI